MREASPRSLLFVVGIMVGSALAFTLLTAPLTLLLGGGAGAVAAAFHGVAAFVYLFVGTIGLYLAWRLLTATFERSRISSCSRSSARRSRSAPSSRSNSQKIA